MKKSILAWGLALSLLLTGCAGMLERSYENVTPHVDRPATADDPSTLRVENYRELVSAVLYLVSQGAEEGAIQFQDYTGQAGEDLAAACLEVADQDPLGAYAVDYIEHELSRVMSHYQAGLSIHYRRSMDQVRAIVNVTGTRAIRDKVEGALAAFDPELVLRVAYFAEDEQFIRDLVRQVYYGAPDAILCPPQMEVTLYPDTGSQRIVEVLFTYPESEEELTRRREELTAAAAEFAYPPGMDREEALSRAAADLYARCDYDPEAGSTAYDALVAGAADDEGLALAYALVCGRLDNVTCAVIQGEYQGEAHFWNEVRVAQGEKLYLDLSRFDQLSAAPHTAQEMADMGYRWADGPEGETPPAETAAQGG